MFSGLADANRHLIDLARALRVDPDVVSVKQRTEFRKYTDAPLLEGFVDAELRSGKAVGCWFEIKFEGEDIQLHRSVRISHEQGEDILLELPVVSVAITSMETALPAALKEICDRMIAIDLASI